MRSLRGRANDLIKGKVVDVENVKAYYYTKHSEQPLPTSYLVTYPYEPHKASTKQLLVAELEVIESKERPGLLIVLFLQDNMPH